MLPRYLLFNLWQAEDKSHINFFQCRFISMLQTRTLAMSNVKKRVERVSIIIYCWNIHWGVPLLLQQTRTLVVILSCTYASMLIIELFTSGGWTWYDDIIPDMLQILLLSYLRHKLIVWGLTSIKPIHRMQDKHVTDVRPTHYEYSFWQILDVSFQNSTRQRSDNEYTPLSMDLGSGNMLDQC